MGLGVVSRFEAKLFNFLAVWLLTNYINFFGPQFYNLQTVAVQKTYHKVVGRSMCNYVRGLT